MQEWGRLRHRVFKNMGNADGRCVLPGDVITAKLPMIIRAETVQDKRPQFQSLKVHSSLVFGLAAWTVSLVHCAAMHDASQADVPMCI